MSVRTGMFPPPSVGPMTSGMPGPMPPMGAAPNPFAPMPPMPLAGMPPPPMMGGMPPPPMGGMPPPPMPQQQGSNAGLGSVAGSNAPRRRMFGDFLESKLVSGQPRPAPQMARPPQMPPQMMPQQQMVAPGTPAMRTPPMQSMMPRPMMYGGEVDVFGYKDGGPVVQYMEDGGLSQVERLLVENHGYTDAGDGMVMTTGGLLYDHEAGDTFSDRLVSGLSSDQIGNTESTERMAAPDDRISRGSTLQIQETPSGRYAVVDTSGEGITFSDIYSGTNSSDFGDKYSKYFDPNSTLSSTGLSYADREAAMNLLNKYGYEYGGNYVAPVVEQPVDSGGGNVVVAQPVSSITGANAGAGIPVGSGGNFGPGSYTADAVDASEVNPINYSQFTGDVGNFSNTGENFALYGPQLNIPQSVSQYMTGPSGGLTTSYGPEMVATSPIGAIKLPARPVSIDIFDWLSAPTYGTMYSGIAPINTGDVSEMRMGGEVSGPFGGSVPRQTMIGDQPHMLAYINPQEAELLSDLGGTGEPGPGGVPAYRNLDADLGVGAINSGGTYSGSSSAVSGGYSHPTDGDDDNDNDKTYTDTSSIDGISAASGTDYNPTANDDNKTYTDTSSIAGISAASGVDYNTGTGSSSSDDDKTYTDTSSIAGISDASGIDYNAGGSGGGGGGGGGAPSYTPPPVYVPPVYTDKRGNTYGSQAEADAANQAIDAFNTQLMSYGAGKEGFNRFADKVESPYIPREDSDRAASQIYSTRFTPELAGYDGPDILGGIYSNIPGIGGSDLGTGDSGATAQPIVDSGIDTSQSSSQQLGQYNIDDDVFNLNPEEDTLSQAVRADVGQDYTPTSAELAAQLANANLPDLRQSQVDVDMSQPKALDFTSQNVLLETGVIRQEEAQKLANGQISQSEYDESIAALDELERGYRNKITDPAYGIFDLRDEDTEDMNDRYSKYLLNRQKEAGDFDGTILGEGEGGIPQRNLDLAGADSRPADAGLGRGAGFKSLDQLKADISKVEGTDDDAGYNRLLDKGETGTFSGNKPLTEMTVAEAIAFGTSDAYRNYSRDVLGRGPNELPSTPMGKYQIVGTTLKDLVDRGLVDPNAQFDADTQEQIGSLLVKNRGYDDVLSGKITEEQFLSNLGNEFEGVKKNENFNLSGGSVDQTGINQVSDDDTSAQDLAAKNKAIYDRGLGADDDPRRGNLSVNAAEAKYLQNLLSTLEFNDEGKLVDKDPNFIQDVFNKLVRNFTLGLVDINDLNKNKVQEVLDAYRDTGSFVYDTEGNAIDLKTVEDLERLEKLSAGEGQNPAVIGVRNEDGETVSFGSDIANTSEGPIEVDDDIFATIATSGDDDTTTTTEVDTGYTTDENGNKICNEAGYVYDVATDSCVPAVAEEESTDTSLNIGSGASRSFEDVLKNIQTKATTIAPISANIKPMAMGGMAGLNRTADNFLRALGG